MVAVPRHTVDMVEGTVRAIRREAGSDVNHFLAAE